MNIRTCILFNRQLHKIFCVNIFFLEQPVTDDGTRTIYIENISPSEARDLRETLRKIRNVTNYLPLLNRVETNTPPMNAFVKVKCIQSDSAVCGFYLFYCSGVY